MHSNKARHRTLYEGQHIVLIKEIINNDLRLLPMTEGKIVHNRNQVEADIWFYSNWSYDKKLNLNSDFHKNGRFEGIVLRVKGDSFAVRFNYDEHSDIEIDESRLLNVPLFSITSHQRKPSNKYMRAGSGKMEQQYKYVLPELVDYVEDLFTDWVQKNCLFRQVTEEERENGDYPSDFETAMTEETAKMFYRLQEKLELEFARATGIYYHFLGGTIEG